MILNTLIPLIFSNIYSTIIEQVNSYPMSDIKK